MDVYVGFFTEDWEGGRKSEKERERQRKGRKEESRKDGKGIAFSLFIDPSFRGGGVKESNLYNFLRR